MKIVIGVIVILASFFAILREPDKSLFDAIRLKKLAQIDARREELERQELEAQEPSPEPPQDPPTA